jgi:hypothetical protein
MVKTDGGVETISDDEVNIDGQDEFFQDAFGSDFEEEKPKRTYH